MQGSGFSFIKKAAIQPGRLIAAFTFLLREFTSLEYTS
jgi:hypothetical protein